MPDSSIRCMLKPIREMEFFIRTAFGESKTSVGGKDKPKQGGCQGNGAAPPMWQQISTTMLRAQHSAGHTVTITTPISKKSIKTAGILYVDDTNLWVGLNENSSLEDAVYEAQEAVSFWGNSLIATGGALNPDKCKWTIHDMLPKPDGTWEYNRCTPALSTIKEGEVYPGTEQVERSDEERAFGDTIDNFQIKVPQALGTPAAAIDQLQSCQAMKNLGVYTPP